MMKHRLRWCGVLLLLFSTQVVALDVSSGDADAKNAPVSVQSQDALAFLKLDFENNPGWIATIKAGYQWNLFRGVGYDVSLAGASGSKKHNVTKDKPALSLGLGYNFGDRLPLTLGLQFGIGGGGNLNTSSVLNLGGNDYLVRSRQKVRVYTLDASIDYDFKNCSNWTPFVGLTGGLAFTNNRGKIAINQVGGGTDEYGKFNKTHHINFVGGFRAGTKYQVNDRITLSLYGSYSYVGSIKGREFSGLNTFEARTKKARVHEIAVKAGLKISF